MRHRRGVSALDVQHLILNPPDVAGTKKDGRCQRQGKATAVGAAGQALQVVHQRRPVRFDGLGLHATILPVPVWPGDPSTSDALTLADDERPLLALDLADEPGRSFRVPPRWYADVSANLTIANMDFSEFADAVDGSGTYRGFDED